jgi:hypothetical protein
MAQQFNRDVDSSLKARDERWKVKGCKSGRSGLEGKGSQWWKNDRPDFPLSYCTS